MTSSDHDDSLSIQIEAAFRSIFGGSGLQLIEGAGTTRSIVESGMSVVRLRAHCRAAIAAAPAGAEMFVVLRAQQTGLLRLIRWIVLPVQVAVTTRTLVRHSAVILGCFAAFPDVIAPSVTYELRSPAQRYAEQFMVAGTPASWLGRTIRNALAIWAGCDPSVGGIFIVAKRP